MNSIKAGDRTVNLDGEGYLENYKDWDEAVALELARTENVELTDDHWVVLRMLREHYEQHESIQTVKNLEKSMKDELGEEKGSSRYLTQLFPNGPATQSVKIAGLPRMAGCT